ncbi:hypothetical protein OQA88_11572 [Cercophora sp. LCS_1]
MGLLRICCFTLAVIAVIGAKADEPIGNVKTVFKDVAIIGGGASGSYSAVRLREDYGVSVVLIEKDVRLGGHVNTWDDPVTGRSFDAGVQSYVDLANSTGFFARMGVATQPNVRNANQAINVDFTTGLKLQNYMAPSAADRNESLYRYLAAAEQFLPILEPGWWTFPGGDAIPPDLMLPFHAFTAKYNFTAGLPQIFGTTGFGVPDLVNSPTLWVMRSFNVDMVRTVLNLIAGFVPSSRRNQDLYDKILTFLGHDVFLSTTVTSSVRSRNTITLTVKNSITGETTRIVAKRLLFTIPPTSENTNPFGLDAAEKETLGQFKYSTSYVGIVSHPALPRDSALINIPSAAQPTNYASAIPKAPFMARFDNYANSPYYRVMAAGDSSLTETQAKGVVTDAFERMVEAGTLNKTEPAEALKFEYFQGHGMLNAYVTDKELRDGFMARLNGLQGRGGMWYTGAAWSVHITTSLWVFTDTVLPRLVRDLKE